MKLYSVTPQLYNLEFLLSRNALMVYTSKSCVIPHIVCAEFTEEDLVIAKLKGDRCVECDRKYVDGSMVRKGVPLTADNLQEYYEWHHIDT